MGLVGEHMAHFAELDNNNKVLRVLVISNEDTRNIHGDEDENVGINFCKNLFGGGTWIQTSYNANFRKNYARIGDTYDSNRDAFISPKPNYGADEWIFNETTCRWEEVL